MTQKTANRSRGCSTTCRGTSPNCRTTMPVTTECVRQRARPRAIHTAMLRDRLTASSTRQRRAICTMIGVSKAHANQSSALRDRLRRRSGAVSPAPRRISSCAVAISVSAAAIGPMTIARRRISLDFARGVDEAFTAPNLRPVSTLRQESDSRACRRFQVYVVVDHRAAASALGGLLIQLNHATIR